MEAVFIIKIKEISLSDSLSSLYKQVVQLGMPTTYGT